MCSTDPFKRWYICSLSYCHHQIGRINLPIDVTLHPWLCVGDCIIMLCQLFMMTSSNGNIFRVTGHLCGEFPVTSEFLAQRPVTRSFDIFFDLCLNKWLSKQSWGWWFEMLPRLLWRHCNVNVYVYQISQLSFVRCVGCVFSAYSCVLWTLWKGIVLYLITIIIRSEIWIISHCLGLGHEMMVCIVFHAIFLTHLPRSAAYMRQWIGSPLVQIMACSLLGAKPLII